MSFNDGHARVARAQADFRCIGGIDNPAAIEDFSKAAKVHGTVMDLFSREQYTAWHGHEPPEEWRAVTPADIRRAAHNERPHIVFSSPPCKGFSGLLSQTRSKDDKYQALCALTVRGVWLTLEAWQDDPPEFFLMENVPRIVNRGRALLDVIENLLHHYGYATAQTTHCCGEIGGLAERRRRRRFLLVARHKEKVPPFLYEPQRRTLRSVGEVLKAFPMPGDVARAGPMHRLAALEWRTWVRLALVEAGSDWRSLQKLRVEDGVLADYAIVPERSYTAGAYGVLSWHETAGTVTGGGQPASGRFSVADPRRAHNRAEYGQYGVKHWSEVGDAITGKAAVGSGRFAVSDPRGLANAPAYGQYGVKRWRDTSATITSQRAPGQGHFSVADPRCGMASRRPHYQTGGHYGVVSWQSTMGVISGSANYDRGRFSVADPRHAAGESAAVPAAMSGVST